MHHPVVCAFTTTHLYPSLLPAIWRQLAGCANRLNSSATQKCFASGLFPAMGIFTFPIKSPGTDILYLLFLFIYIFKLLLSQSQKSSKVSQSQEIGFISDENVAILKVGQSWILLWFLILSTFIGQQGHPAGHGWIPPCQQKMFLLLWNFQFRDLQFWHRHSDCIITAEKKKLSNIVNYLSLLSVLSI